MSLSEELGVRRGGAEQEGQKHESVSRGKIRSTSILRWVSEEATDRLMFCADPFSSSPAPTETGLQLLLLPPFLTLPTVSSSYWEEMKRAVDWARWADRQYPCIYSRLEFGLSWESSTRQLLGYENLPPFSPLRGLKLQRSTAPLLVH